MINAASAYRESNEAFERNYKAEIKFVEDKIWEVVLEGFRSVWIDKDEGNWVGESEVQTNRLITYFKEQGFQVKIEKENVGSMSMWRDNCNGIEISWDLQ